MLGTIPGSDDDDQYAVVPQGSTSNCSATDKLRPVFEPPTPLNKDRLAGGACTRHDMDCCAAMRVNNQWTISSKQRPVARNQLLILKDLSAHHLLTHTTACAGATRSAMLSLLTGQKSENIRRRLRT